MTSEPPTESVGRNRPAPGARRAALGLPADKVRESPSAQHRGLLSALADIPDLDPETGELRIKDPSSGVWDDSGPFVTISTDPGPETTEPDTTDAEASGEDPKPFPGRRAKPDAATGAPPRWRTPAFFLALVVLVASIPALGWVGYNAVSDSKDGKFQNLEKDPKAPGYEAQVDPTPTSAVIQYGPLGRPVGITFISLTRPEGGGGVVFFPLATEVPAPQDGIFRLSDTFRVLNPDAQAVRDRLTAGVAALLDLGIEDVTEVDDARLAALVAPVAPLLIDNPEPLTLLDGTRVPAGRAEITATQVGPYLAATREGESESARLNRSRVLWSAWLGQIRASTDAAPVGGELTSGLGADLLALAKGQVDITTLPVGPDRSGSTGANESLPPDIDAIGDLVTELVPSPTPTGPPGFRFRTRLLNGVEPGPPSVALTRRIVSLGGTVTIVGNSSAFGQEQTNLIYADRAQKSLATLVLQALGGTGKAIYDPTASDTSDFTVILGRDVADNPPTDPTAITTTTTKGD